ncbi:MAG: metal-dependent hydrolase [bacterium]
MQAIYYGHSCFSLTNENTTILFDPFLNDNPLAPRKASFVQADYILVSHNHSDHSADTVEIALKNNSLVISTFDYISTVQKAGITGHGMNIGGSYQFPFGKVKLTPAIHSSGMPEGIACGFIVQFFNKTFYFAGDTALFSDMSLIRRYQIDYALLPIGSNFTMDIEDAVEAVKLIQPKKVIPIHYNTWPVIKADPKKFKELVEKETAAECLIAPIGEKFSLE